MPNENQTDSLQNQPIPEPEPALPVPLTGKEKKALVEDILKDVDETIRDFQDSDDEGVQEVVARLRAIKQDMNGEWRAAKKWGAVVKNVKEAIFWIKLGYDILKS